MATETPAERVRNRMKRWLEVTGITQGAFAQEIQKSQVWLQKILTGENHVRLRDLDDVAHAMRTTAAELVRTEDERYQLELSPTEVRVLEQLRRRPELVHAITTFLNIPSVVGHKPVEKHTSTK